MREDGILIAEQSMTYQLKRSSDLQYFPQALTGIDGHLERNDGVDQLVLSSPSTNMIVPNVFFKLLLWQISVQSYLISKVLEGND